MNHIKTSQEQTTSSKTSPPAQSESTMASFWDESQIQAIIRHAGATGRSPEEFFSKKWKKVLCHRAS